MDPNQLDNVLGYQPSSSEDFYAILGCDELSTIEQIQTEYRARVVGSHPDKAVGDEKDDANERFQVLQRAKQVLTDPELRRNYDAWRRSGLSISFKDWMGNKNATFMSMHWANSQPKKAMIQSGEQNDSHQQSHAPVVQPTDSPWQRHDSDIVRKFRQYEI